MKYDTETDKERAQKKAKLAPLHRHDVTPLSFILDAAKGGSEFEITKKRQSFGNNLEAYARPCYEDILQLILSKRKECRTK